MRPKKITFSIAAQTAIQDAETRVKLGQNSPRLVSDYKDRLKHCDAFFGDMSISKIDARKLREFRDELASKGLKATAIAPVMSFVNVVLRLAHEDGLITHKPPIPRRSQKPTPRSAFNRDEYQKLLLALKSIEKASPPIMCFPY